MVANPRPSDHDTLAALNADYIRSVQRSDTRRFDEILSPDFLNSNPDGTIVDRTGFLTQIAKPVTIRNLAVEDVRIRILGDTGIIHARTTYTKSDGTQGAGRYTDIWMRRTLATGAGSTGQRDGGWLCVAAHVTRG